MTTLLRTIDPYLTNIGGAMGAYKEAYNHGNSLDMIESAVETNNAVTQLFYYLGSAPKYMGFVGVQIMAATTELFKKTAPLLATIALATWLAALSIVAGTGCFIKESLSLVRQIRFISLFDASEDPLALIKNLKETDPLILKRSLPEWLYDKIQGPSAKMTNEEKARDRVWQHMLSKDLYNSLQETKLAKEPKTTPITADQIRSYAVKKSVLHVIGQIAAVLAIVGGVGVFITFPPALVIALLALSIAIGITAYVYKKGVVDNPDGGLSLKKCVPEFILNLPKTMTDLSKSVTEHIEEQSKRRAEYKTWLATPVSYRSSRSRFNKLHPSC
jgi:hypothetical protein